MSLITRNTKMRASKLSERQDIIAYTAYAPHAELHEPIMVTLPEISAPLFLTRTFPARRTIGHRAVGFASTGYGL